MKTQPHLAVCLPEIVSHVISFLIPAHEDTKIKYRDVHPCLTVNRLWHDCASRPIWRRAFFEDVRDDMDLFLKFAAVIANTPMLSHHNITTTTTTADALAIGQHTSPRLSPVQPSPVIASLPSDSPGETPIEPDTQATESRLDLYRKSLRMLSVRKIKEKSVNEPLAFIGKVASRLEHLDIYICDHFSNQTLSPFLDHQSLTFLSLAGCHHISDEAILKVANTCRQLEHLDLRACGLVSDDSLSAVALQCRRLKHLNVGRIRDRDRVTIRSIGLIARHTEVSVLGLAGCDMDDACMAALAEYRATGLERVSVNSCFKISNQTVYRFIEQCPSLSVFEMKECHHVNDWEAVAELVQRKVLLTLCEQQNRAFSEWARIRGRLIDVKPPLK